MPTLNIEGHSVNVDPSFLGLSPEAQNATVEEIAKSLPKTPKSGSLADAAGVSAPVQNFDTGGAIRAVTDVPVLGPLADKLNSAVDAGVAGIPGLADLDKSMGLTLKTPPSSAPTFGERYSENLASRKARDEAFHAAHPILAPALNVAGGVAATLPIAATGLGARALGIGADTLGGMVAGGATSGAGIGATDAALRGEDPLRAAQIGGIVGGAAPLAAKAVGSLVSGIRNVRQPEAIPTNTVDIAGVPVRRSMGQVTGDFDTIMGEQGALRNTAGAREQRVADEFFTGQTDDLTKASDAIAAKLSPTGNVVAADPQAAAEIASEAVRKAAVEARAGYQAKYDDFSQIPGYVPRQAFDKIGDSIKNRLTLGANPIVIDDVTTPNAAKALRDLQQQVGDTRLQNQAAPNSMRAETIPRQEIDGIGLSDLDQARKRLLSFYRDAKTNPADARATKGVIQGFDDHLETTINSGLFSGNEAALPALKDARAAYANYRKTFGTQGVGDDAGRVIEKILGKTDGVGATPTEVSNWLYGANGIGGSGLSVRVGQRLKGVLGEGSPEWTGVRQGMWSKLTGATEGRTDWGPQKVSERIAEFLNGGGKPLSHVMFTDGERNLMTEYAKLLKQITPPPGTVNHSNTAATLGKMMRGSIDGIFALGGLHVGGPAGVVAGYAAHQGQKAIQDVVKASKVARSLYGTPSGIAAQAKLHDSLVRLAAITSRGATTPATAH